MKNLVLLARHRLRLNVRSGWYVAAAVALVLLILGAFYNSWRSYQHQSQLFTANQQSRIIRLEQARMYRDVSVLYALPPSPLSVLSRGASEELGSAATIWGRFGRTEITRAGQDFPGPLGSVRAIGIGRAVAWIVSLVIVFLAHDCVNGQRQLGTLKMSLAGPVSRTVFLVGEATGHLVTLALPILFAFLALAALIYHLELPFEGQDWLRFAGFFAATLFYVAVWVALAIFLSIVCAAPATSLIAGVILWIAATTVYPNGIAWLSTHSLRERGDLVRLPHRDWTKSGDDPAPYPTTAERRQIEDSWNLRVRQYERQRRLGAVVPSTAYVHLAEVLSRTDASTYVDFIRDVGRTEAAFRAWQIEKLDQYPEREKTYVYGAPPLDLQGLPEPAFDRASLRDSVAELLPVATVQLAVLSAIVAACYVGLQRMDVRS